MYIILFLILGGLMHAARTFAPVPGLLGGDAGGTILACGYLLLAGVVMGNLFSRIGLPKLTGYLAAGMLAGPYSTDLVSETMVLNLRVFNGVAISLIALTAGCEMEFRTMRPLFRTIGWITVIAIQGTICLLIAAVYLASPWLPFTEGLDTVELLAISAVIAVAMSAQSPAVVVALRNETDADGPMMRTVLGVVVLCDLVVILLFALVSGIARSVLEQQSGEGVGAGMLAWEIFGSGGVGVVVGLLIAGLLRNLKTGGGLFAVISGFMIAEVGRQVHLDPLLVALVAGLIVRNLTRMGDRLHAAIETASLPVYVAFFAVAGATIHLDRLPVVGIPAALFVIVRAAGFLTGSNLAARVAGAPEVVRKWAGFGLLPQAGLALALALLFTRAFPGFGEAASALIFAVVALNEIVCPVLFRWALVKSGEAGQLAHPKEEPEDSALPAPAPLG